MVTSSQRGHKTFYRDGRWLYLDNNVPVEIPDSWRDRCSGNGYKRYTDKDGNRRYADNGMKVSGLLWSWQWKRLYSI